MNGFVKAFKGLLVATVLLVSGAVMAAETATPASPAAPAAVAPAAPAPAPAPVVQAPTAAPATAPVLVPPVSALSSGIAGQLMQLVLGLGLVVALIFGLAWLMRRVQRAGPAGNHVIELVGSRALGPRDRLVLVQVGNEQVLLGISPGSITALHVMNEPVKVPDTQNATPEFAKRLLEVLGKQGQKDKN